MVMSMNIVLLLITRNGRRRLGVTTLPAVLIATHQDQPSQRRLQPFTFFYLLICFSAKRLDSLLEQIIIIVNTNARPRTRTCS